MSYGPSMIQERGITSYLELSLRRVAVSSVTLQSIKMCPQQSPESSPDVEGKRTIEAKTTRSGGSIRERS